MPSFLYRLGKILPSKEGCYCCFCLKIIVSSHGMKILSSYIRDDHFRYPFQLT